jgi:hypothetical protein
MLRTQEPYMETPRIFLLEQFCVKEGEITGFK